MTTDRSQHGAAAGWTANNRVGALWMLAAIIVASAFFIVRRTIVPRRAAGPNPKIKNGRP